MHQAQRQFEVLFFWLVNKNILVNYLQNPFFFCRLLGWESTKHDFVTSASVTHMWYRFKRVEILAASMSNHGEELERVQDLGCV